MERAEEGDVKRLCIALAAASLGGCVTTETVRFDAKQNQQALVRDGQPALVSRQRNSLVLIRPAAREMRPGSRPVFVVGMYNLTNAPLDFRVGKVAVTQTIGGQVVALEVITYETLVSEERTRQVFNAVVVGLAAGANAAAAANAGRYHSSSTVYGPRGTYQVHTTGYSPTAAAIAQSNASAQNDAMISATIERGQANLNMLEQTVIKDNTLLPGEWYGGQLHIQPLVSDSAMKTYQIAVRLGADLHEVSIQQGAATQ
jgi:hypothetical protein